MELDEFIELVKEQQGIDLSGVLTTADKIDRPERALEKQAIIDFENRNPMAGGGMLVQPSADGSRPGYKQERKGANPYFSDKKFLKYAKENFNFTPGDKVGGDVRASMVSQYLKQLALKGKIKGIEGLITALGEDNPYTASQISSAFINADRKITKNMDRREKSKIKRAKNIRDIIVSISGNPQTLGEVFEPYGKYIKYKPSEGKITERTTRFNPEGTYQAPTRVFTLNKSQLNKINKNLIKHNNKFGFQDDTIDNIYNLFDDKKFLKEVKKYDGKAVDIDSYLFKKVFEPGTGGKNAYAYMQLGRILRGEIQLDGINVDKKLGNKIIQSISHSSSANIEGEMGKAAQRWAKFQMAKFFDDPNVTYRSLTNTITNAFKKVGAKNIDIDEIFPARTGQITYAKGSGVYNQFIQAIDSKINQKSKRAFDGRMSSRLQTLDPAYKLAQKTGDYSQVKSIIEAHDLDIENFYKNNPEAKGKVNLTKFRFDDKTKKFLSPEQVFESQYKGAYETIPLKIRKGMEKFYSKTGISIDPGTAVTLEQVATELKGDKKQQSEILRKMGFKCKFAKAAADGGRIRLKKGTPLDKCDDPANYMEDINKTKADLNSNDVTVRAAANAKLNNGLNIAKKLPEIGTFLRRAGQATVGTVSSALKALGFTSPVGYAIEGMVEGGVYDYFRKQGYTHDQAYAETFTPGIITGRPEGVPWYGGAESLLEKELLGSGFQQNSKVLQYQKALEDQQQIYDAFADKERGIKAQRKDITDAASADIQDAFRSGMVSRVNRIMNPESMASQAYQTAVETQAGKQDQRARDYMAENYAQIEPSEFQQEQLQKERNEAMLELFPPPTVDQIRAAYTAAGYKDLLPFMTAEDYKKEMKAADDYQKQSYFADNFRLEKAGGGIAKIAGVDQGPPPESGPNPQGLQGLMKRVKNI